MADEVQEFLDYDGLAEYHSKVNDMTTGINLLRGTRDFQIGTETIGSGYYTDGFNPNSVSSNTIKKTVEDEFTVVTVTSSGSNQAVIASIIKNIKAGETYTFSADIRVNSGHQNFANTRILQAYTMAPDDFNKTYNSVELKYSDSNIDFTDGEWHRVKIKLKITDDHSGTAFLVCRGWLNNNVSDASISYRCFDLQAGDINNPVWSPSSFDIDYINDYTTATNLFVGTRDFHIGTTFGTGNSYYKDGFRKLKTTQNVTIASKPNELAEAELGQDAQLGSPILENVPSGDYTYSFDIQFNDVQPAAGLTLCTFIYNNQGSGIAGTLSNCNLPSEPELGKWYRAIHHATNKSASLMVVRFENNYSGTIKVRAVSLNTRRINNPLWSLNPFDISTSSSGSVDTSALEAQLNSLTTKVDKINDYTTGINLLRGTRDFNAATKTAEPITGNKFPLDGVFTDKISLSKDENGFAIATFNNDSNSTLRFVPYYGRLEAGEKFTISAKIKITDRITNTRIGYIGIVDNKNYGVQKFGINFTTENSIGRNLELNKWYEVRYVYTIPETVEDGIFLSNFLCQQPSPFYELKQPCMYKGDINNPIWSSSPFDIDTIDDYTTGINLFRKTLDFGAGTEKAYSYNGQVMKDGFGIYNNSSTSPWSEYVDSEGFTVRKVSRSDETTSLNSWSFTSAVTNCVLGDKYTISFEIMVEDVAKLDADYIARFVEMRETAANAYNITLTQCGIDRSTLESGKWYQVIYHHTVVAQELGFAIAPFIQLNGTVHFRKFNALHGYINKPIWSASPFDGVQQSQLDSINDYTTGINLLRGTGDFKLGSEENGTYFRRDGFYLNPTNNVGLSFSVDNEGFGICTLENVSGHGNITTSCVNGIYPNEDYTISFEFMFDSIEPNKYPTSYFFTIGEYATNTTSLTGERVKMNDISLAKLGYNSTTIQAGKWLPAKVVFTTSDQADPNNEQSFIAAGITMPTAYAPGCKVHYRKLKIERGNINNPVWSANPFDMGSINDMTTGINLLRGTRDFVLGDPSHQIPTTKGTFYSNGFSNTGNFEFYKDDQGFTVASKSGNGSFGLYTVVQDSGIAGKSMTLSFDIKLDNISEFNTTNAAFAVSYYDGSELVAINRVNISDVINKGAQDGKWLNYVDYLTIPSSNVEFVYITMAKYVGNGTISFRKLMLQEGHINHPIWSPSPFDTDYINDEPTGINLLLGTRDFIFGSHKTPQNSYVYSDGFYKTSLAPGVTYTTYKDDQGFTVCHLENTLSATIGVYSSACYGLEKGNYTVSFDCKIESKDENVSLNTLLSSINYTGGSISKIDTNDPFKHQNDDHDWHTYTIHFNLSNDLPENSFVYVYILITGRAVVNFRKAGMYKGYINNPVWSASPFDVVEKSDLNADNLKGIVPWEKGGTNSNSRIAANNNIFTNVTPQVAMPDLDNPVSYGVNLYSDATSNKINGLNYATVFTIGTHTNFTSGYRNQFIFNAQNNRVWYRNKTDSGQWAAPATLAYLSDLTALTSQIQTLQAALLSNGTITTEDLEKASQQSTIQEISSQDDNEVDNHDSSIADVNQQLPNESDEISE